MADIDICLPLLKFSHATGLVDGRIAWDHISGHNIFVVLKGSRHEGRSLILRVVQGTKDLVRHQPMRRCVCRADLTITRSKSTLAFTSMQHRTGVGKTIVRGFLLLSISYPYLPSPRSRYWQFDTPSRERYSILASIS